jgi:UDP-N-acetylmuramoyl-L-alanyl-D-glutamate--2,6-diaminopimelate ligase
MKLAELLQPWLPTCTSQCNILALTSQSSAISDGSLFFAHQGSRYDGRDFILDALRKGAAAVVYDPEPHFSDETKLKQTWPDRLFAIPDLKQKLGHIASRFYHDPSQATTVIAVTGTNGKTSSCYLTTHFLRLMRKPCGMIGTIGHGFNHALETSYNTTPDALTLQYLFSQFYDSGCRYVVMEASSHGLDQGRMNGTQVKIALFTNLTRDHLDYHKTMKDYQRAKLRLFEFPSLEVAIVNLDDDFSSTILQHVHSGTKKYGYTLKSVSAPEQCLLISAENIILTNEGIQADVLTPWGKLPLNTSLLGRHNLANLLGVIAVLGELGTPLNTIKELIKNPPPIPGRMQRFGEAGQPLVIVDYAHTPDAMEHLLATVRQHALGQVTVVFGCGGDRDQGKRAPMGSIAARFADEIILTDDNPRTEASLDIIAQIKQGVPVHALCHIETNRAVAISQAILSAKPDTTIVIAGKGHETYQEIDHERYPFSDADEVNKALRAYQAHKVTE